MSWKSIYCPLPHHPWLLRNGSQGFSSQLLGRLCIRGVPGRRKKGTSEILFVGCGRFQFLRLSKLIQRLLPFSFGEQRFSLHVSKNNVRQWFQVAPGTLALNPPQFGRDSRLDTAVRLIGDLAEKCSHAQRSLQ